MLVNPGNADDHYEELPNVSNDFIDDIYSKAIKNGAIGGKLLGAGKGGFMFFICKKGAKEKLSKSLKPFSLNRLVTISGML